MTLAAGGVGAQPLMELKEVVRVTAAINSNTEESYPLQSPDGRLYFVRSLYPENVGGVRAGQDIWYVEPMGNGWSEASNALGKLNNLFNNGVVGIADSGKVLYLNSTYSNKLDYQIGLTRSEFTKGSWSKPSRVHLKGFNPKSGYLSFYVDDALGVMVLSFSSSVDDNEDLYLSLREGGVWQKPFHLGSTINTPGAEFAPFLSQDGRVLYFSSTGHPGMGSADIFYVRRLSDGWHSWSEAQALPEPINSAAFDAYFTISGNTAYFASNRDGDFSDIYMARYELLVQEERPALAEEEDEATEAPRLLVGYVSDKKLGKLERVDVLDANGKLLQSVQPDDQGGFVVENLEDDRSYYIDLVGALNDPAVYVYDEQKNEVGLQREVMRNRFMFEMGKGSIKEVVQAQVLVAGTQSLKDMTFYLETGKLPDKGATISLLDENDQLIERVTAGKDGGFTFQKLDNEGKYRLKIDDESLEGSMLFVMKDGTRSPVDIELLKGLYFRLDPDGSIVLKEPETAMPGDLDVSRFAFDYQRLDMVGTTVYLYNEHGEEIEKAEVGEDGSFEFQRLDPRRKYSIGLENEKDLAANMPGLYGFDEENNKVALSGEIPSGREFLGDPAKIAPVDEGREVFSFDEGALPPAGSKVYLTDENDRVVDSSYVDAGGNFSFTRLSPDGNYKIKLASTEDLSLGLDRFFIVDAEGSKIELDDKGETSGRIVGEELARTTETFTFADEAAPPAGTLVYLTDEDNNVIDSAVVDEFGEIRFTRLPPDGNFKLKLDKVEDLSMGLDRFFIIDAEGDKIGFDEQGSSKKSIIGRELASTTETFTFAEEAAPPAGTLVYLTDVDDNVIDSAVVDEYGEIRFTRLPPDGNFKLKLDKVEDLSMGLDRFFIIDAEGDKIAFNEQGTTEKPLIGKELAATTETFTFAEEAAPPAGTLVYLTDEDDNVIDSAVVDEYGEIRFTRLPPDGNFKLRLDKVEDLSMGLDRFFIIDAAGEQVAFDKEGKTSHTLTSSEKLRSTSKSGSAALLSSIVEYYRFNYDRLPPAGTVVYLLDEGNHIIDSAVVDGKGGFQFGRLKPEFTYFMELKAPDGNRLDFESHEVVDSGGNTFLLMQGHSNELMVSAMNAEERDARYDRFVLAMKHPPVAGTKVYVYDAAGQRVDSTYLFTKGRFVFEKLPPGQTYSIRIKGEGLDFSAEELYLILKDHRRRLPYLKRGFSYRPMGELVEDDTRLDVQAMLEDGVNAVEEKEPTGEPLAVKGEGGDKVADAGLTITGATPRLHAPESDPALLRNKEAYRALPEGFKSLTDQERDGEFDVFEFDERYLPDADAMIYICDKRGTVLDSSGIYEGGLFYYEELNKLDIYHLKMGDRVYSMEELKLYKLEGSERKEVRKEDDRFVYMSNRAAKLKEPEFVMSLTGVHAPESMTQESREKFPLTPPVDEREQALAVEDNKVNKTVFEEARPAEAKPVTKKAVATLDATDYINKSGIAQVIETEKGWNLQFDFNAFLLSEYQIDYIYEVVIPMLKSNPDMILTLEGHTDDIGADDANYRVSIMRISSVLYHIEMAGIEDTRIKVVPKGESEPIAPNTTVEGRALNRRVEVVKDSEE